MKEKRIEEIMSQLPYDFEEAMKSLVYEDEKEERAYQVYKKHIEKGYSHEEAEKLANLEKLK